MKKQLTILVPSTGCGGDQSFLSGNERSLEPDEDQPHDLEAFYSYPELYEEETEEQHKTRILDLLDRIESGEIDQDSLSDQDYKDCYIALTSGI